MKEDIDVTEPPSLSERPTVPDMPGVRKVRDQISRQDAKRIRNLTTVAINRATDGRERIFQQMEKDLKKAREDLHERTRHYNNLKALLEACVRRYGTLAFDREVIQGICARGRVSYDVLPDRIVVNLLPDLEAVECHTVAETLDSE